MTHDDARRVVIIKNINSNIIEEAILILKKDAKNIKNKNVKAKKINRTYKPEDSNYIVKEAQNIIDNYIKRNSLTYKYGLKTNDTGKKKKSYNIGVLLNIGLIISIAVFILLLSRII